MKPMLKSMIASACSILALGAMPTAQAEISGDVVKIGFITDISGPYSDTDGSGGVEAVKMAIEDFGGKVNGKKIEFIYADHLNKADIAAGKAREWFDAQGVDMILGGANSGAALATAKVAVDKKKVYINVGAGAIWCTMHQKVCR